MALGERLPTTTICIVFGSVAKWIALCTELKPRPFNISLSNLFCRSWHTADDSNAVHSGWGRSPLPGEAVRISAPSAVGLRAQSWWKRIDSNYRRSEGPGGLQPPAIAAMRRFHVWRRVKVSIPHDLSGHGNGFQDRLPAIQRHPPMSNNFGTR